MKGAEILKIKPRNSMKNDIDFSGKVGRGIKFLTNQYFLSIYANEGDVSKRYVS